MFDLFNKTNQTLYKKVVALTLQIEIIKKASGGGFKKEESQKVKDMIASFDEFKEKVDSQFEFNATKINSAVGKINHITDTFEELEVKINSTDKVF